MESQNLPKLQDLDTKSQISQFEWTLHIARRKVFLYKSSVTCYYMRSKRVRKLNKFFNVFTHLYV